MMRKTDLSVMLKDDGKNGIPVERLHRLYKGKRGGLYVKVDGVFVPVDKVARIDPEAEEIEEVEIAE